MGSLINCQHDLVRHGCPNEATFRPEERHQIGDVEMVDCAADAAAESNRQYLDIRKRQHSGIPLVGGVPAPQYGVDVLAFHCRIDSFKPSPCGAVSL
ncbi:hypothetical protein AmaxDRAFT_4556 [Limnospira maxima CS-328]|uniref:Uncharacterized protein n=1 Tax=Limnospira maxima CS-328 TaxID=513049 RepID=B5W706_LIMMA|nr:hypothetical protein AmaxDRAFT_4556 [Limnospira maxima CS-328]